MNPTLSFSVDDLAEGQSGTLCVSDEAKAGQTVTVDVQDEANPPHGMSVPVTLNALGIGCTTWTRPSGWVLSAAFTYSTATPVTVTLS